MSMFSNTNKTEFLTEFITKLHKLYKGNTIEKIKEEIYFWNKALEEAKTIIPEKASNSKNIIYLEEDETFKEAITHYLEVDAPEYCDIVHCPLSQYEELLLIKSGIDFTVRFIKLDYFTVRFIKLDYKNN